ncbi:FecR domain-containing protein [Sphingosinicella sp. LHD-64]|uniref:FecR family protein n=1 Tax=Sphingosinicella sp. LHD-64 TaxID=3072139 RepID=UPI00280F0357|nr:FecR domain-containing protein [Sphingosinicella sp. LHD-64]MDQ8756230.1 FecR domain-containing protein [Sphingosinicella sp. LHD-64]
MSPSEAAAYWLAAHERGDLDSTDSAEFALWHAEPNNVLAYAKATRALTVFDLDDGTDPHLLALRQAALEAAPTVRHRIPILIAGLAASILIAMFAIGVLDLSTSLGVPPDRSTIAQSDRDPIDRDDGSRVYVTAAGERRSIRLPDGSSVMLNTRSRLVVAFTGGRRLVRLVHGQALFEVAHDSSRPFIVEAADRHITALGTTFDVRVDPGRVQVVLVEGQVVIERASLPTPGAAEIEPATLRPGEEYVAELGAALQVTSVDPARETLWRDGFIEFDDEPLAHAVAEMNRYTDRPIILSNDGVGALRLSGIYRTGSPDRFVNTLREILPIDARAVAGGRIELSLLRSTDTRP